MINYLSDISSQPLNLLHSAVPLTFLGFKIYVCVCICMCVCVYVYVCVCVCVYMAVGSFVVNLGTHHTYINTEHALITRLSDRPT
jgi:hypothetical protein